MHSSKNSWLFNVLLLQLTCLVTHCILLGKYPILKSILSKDKFNSSWGLSKLLFSSNNFSPVKAHLKFCFSNNLYKKSDVNNGEYSIFLVLAFLSIFLRNPILNPFNNLPSLHFLHLSYLLLSNCEVVMCLMFPQVHCTLHLSWLLISLGISKTFQSLYLSPILTVNLLDLL